MSTSFDGSAVRFTFGIPRGADGSDGTNADLARHGAQSDLSDLDLTIGDPPRRAEVQQVVTKRNELMAARRRPL